MSVRTPALVANIVSITEGRFGVSALKDTNWNLTWSDAKLQVREIRRKQASFIFSSSLPRSSGLGLDLKISSLMTSHDRDLCSVLNWLIVAHKNSNCPGTNQGHAGLVGFRFLYGTFSVESKMPKVPFCFIHMSKSVGDNFKRPFRNARFMILFSRSIALKHQASLGNSKLPPPVTCTIWACSVQFYAFVRQIVAELS